MLGLNGMAKKKMDDALQAEQSYAKEGWETVFKGGLKIEDSDCELHLALMKAWYQHPVVRIHVHVRAKEMTYEMEANSREDLVALEMVRTIVV